MEVLLNYRSANRGTCGIHRFLLKKNNEKKKKKTLTLCEIWFLSINKVKSMAPQVSEVPNL